MKLNENGRKVSAFSSKMINLGRIAELSDAIVDMANSGAWRDYTFATGREQWLESEFDYFLIANDVSRDDAARALAYNKEAKELAPLLDPAAEPDKRRSLSAAAAGWHRLNIDLMERAQSLGWINANGSHKGSPVPKRARLQAEHGMTRQKLEQDRRKQRIPAARRRELDAMLKELRVALTDDERRYVATSLLGPKPTKTKDELSQWRADVERIGRKPTVLARHWGVSRMQAHRRLERISA